MENKKTGIAALASVPVLVAAGGALLFILVCCCCGFGAPTDEDQDGVSNLDDCDRKDPAVNTSRKDDEDCDGVSKATDCDDADKENKHGKDQDSDCDGVLSAEDCAPDDKAITSTKAVDGDCDSIPDAQDCDPAGHVGDGDCDGVVDKDDCGPADGKVTATRAGDQDCDGLADPTDCAPTDSAVATSKDVDRDCDGVADKQDCDPDGHTEDRDCDEIANDKDCDPTGHVGDRDCDAVLDAKDCEPEDKANDAVECTVPFHAGLAALCADFDAAPNELKKGQIVDKARALMRGSRMNDVRGKLHKFPCNDTATGCDLYVDVGEYRISTYDQNDPLGSMLEGSIKKGTPIYNAAAEMAVGDCVMFSAKDFKIVSLMQRSEVCEGFTGGHSVVAKFTSFKKCPTE